MIIECVCPFCGVFSQITVDLVQYTNWINGESIQRAFPDLTPSERESIKTGICDECWELL